jgi:hypothetical protein
MTSRRIDFVQANFSAIGDGVDPDVQMPAAQALEQHQMEHRVTAEHVVRPGAALLWIVEQGLSCDFIPEVRMLG